MPLAFPITPDSSGPTMPVRRWDSQPALNRVLTAENISTLKRSERLSQEGEQIEQEHDSGIDEDGSKVRRRAEPSEAVRLDNELDDPIESLSAENLMISQISDESGDESYGDDVARQRDGREPSVFPVPPRYSRNSLERNRERDRPRYRSHRYSDAEYEPYYSSSGLDGHKNPSERGSPSRAQSDIEHDTSYFGLDAPRNRRRSSSRTRLRTALHRAEEWDDYPMDPVAEPRYMSSLEEALRLSREAHDDASANTNTLAAADKSTNRTKANHPASTTTPSSRTKSSTVSSDSAAKWRVHNLNAMEEFSKSPETWRAHFDATVQDPVDSYPAHSEDPYSPQYRARSSSVTSSQDSYDGGSMWSRNHLDIDSAPQPQHSAPARSSEDDFDDLEKAEKQRARPRYRSHRYADVEIEPQYSDKHERKSSHYRSTQAESSNAENEKTYHSPPQRRLAFSTPKERLPLEEHYSAASVSSTHLARDVQGLDRESNTNLREPGHYPSSDDKDWDEAVRTMMNRRRDFSTISNWQARRPSISTGAPAGNTEANAKSRPAKTFDMDSSEQTGTRERQTTPTERWDQGDPPPKPRPETAAILAASLHRFQQQNPEFPGIHQVPAQSPSPYTHDASPPTPANLNKPGSYTDEEYTAEDSPEIDTVLLQTTLEIFRDKNADPSFIPREQLHDLSIRPVHVQARVIEAYSRSIQKLILEARNNRLNKSKDKESIRPGVEINESAILKEALENYRGKKVHASPFLHTQMHNLSMQSANVQTQSVEAHSLRAQREMQDAMNNHLNKLNTGKSVNPNNKSSDAQHTSTEEFNAGTALADFYADAAQPGGIEESTLLLGAISGEETTFSEAKAAGDNSLFDIDNSREHVFEQRFAYKSDSESIDSMSTESAADTFAASSSVPISGKGSSTQPTTAPTSKQNFSYGDEKIAEDNGDTGNDYDTDSIRTDNREIGMLNETKMKLSRYFAAELYSSIQALQREGCASARETFSALPELLRQFSLLAEQRVRSSLEQRAAAFVRHRRNAIAACFKSKYTADLEREPRENSSRSEPNYVDRMNLLWSGDRTGTAHEKAEVPLDRDLASIGDLDEDDETEEEDMTFPPDIEIAIDFLLAGEECQWLLNQVRVASQTTTTGDTYMNVRRHLTESLGDHRQQVFEVSWNPVTFVRQQYESVESFDLGFVVCISGKAELAQATICKDYIEMMWPTTGTSIVSKLNQLIRQGFNLTEDAELDNNTSCIDQMMVSNDHLIVKATGSQIELLELGEVLTWLGAACRASNNDRITYCIPQIACERSACCSINYEFSEIDALDSGTGSGSKCWLKIFNNPTIVRGYPVRLREQGEPGLEIPINMAAVLGYAGFATFFNDHFLLKGPCSALIPTIRQETTIIWHYIVNDNQEPLTYEQALGRQPDCPKIDLFCLEGSRHFVGWTPKVRILTGTRHAEYDNIGYGGPFIEKPGHALSEVVVGGGYKYFNIGGTFTPGKKDYHHFQGISGPYQLQIRLAGQYHVVLYDAADRRGWLLDGTSFVLHLARAALSHPSGHFADDSADRLTQQFIHLDQDSNAAKRVTAKDVLMNPANRQIAMFPDLGLSAEESEKASTWRFEDLVIHYCNILDNIRGHQIKLQQSHQWKVQNPLTKPKALEGFGFLDILQMEPDLRPRAVKLTSSASHWLKITEKAGAINILGSNFGDLMAPLQEPCQRQLYVPCGVDFLAAPVGILQQIATKRCGISKDSFQLADGIAWTKPSASFANRSCFCNDNQKPRGNGIASKPRECHVHITEVGPPKPILHQAESGDSKDVNIDYRDGAVILGRRCDLSKARISRKRPPLGLSEDVDARYEVDKSSHDSGIDVTSIGRSSTS